MNTKNLTKLYDTLTTEERLPLYLAAHWRGDMSEELSLRESAPTVTLRAADFAGHVLGVMTLHGWHKSDQAEHAANYFSAMYGMRDADPGLMKTATLAAQKSAYTYSAALEAWRLFMQEIGVDPD